MEKFRTAERLIIFRLCSAAGNLVTLLQERQQH